MVLRQCLACNMLITESSRSCVCGHVHEDANRYIGGKRFSEYRAQLYSRLENRRKKKESREIRAQTQSLQGHKNLISGSLPSFKPKKQRSVVTRTSNKKKRSKRMPRLQTALSSTPTKLQDSKSGVPQELLSRLPSALQEINRRIMGQNFIWLALQLD
ncbi:hypothetical protein OS493_017808 [Desmophyllum pertusum]|uniref:Uncharacterized protein n=1 Tax=Desmophyllum pertusum TaxID=174260 RepID=A0A9W9ZD96_9CNID|nr:hypothetical protein OS493_017808 [Desmophyllum pertusum]